jgi:hypothetical protein
MPGPADPIAAHRRQTGSTHQDSSSGPSRSRRPRKSGEDADLRYVGGGSGASQSGDPVLLGPRPMM